MTRFCSLVPLLIAVLFCGYKSVAQVALQQLDNRNGLSNSCINSIYEDDDHIMWIGTWDGLNYYDGHNFHVFNYEKSAHPENSLTSNVIYKIAGDHQRNIWLGTVGGVSRFDKNTGKITSYFYNKNRSVPSTYVVASDRDDRVYAIRRNNNKLYLFDRRADRFNLVKISGRQLVGVGKILFDDQNNLWVLQDDASLASYRITSKGLLLNAFYKPEPGVDNVFVCNRHVFMSTKDGNLSEIKTGIVKQITHLPYQIRTIEYYQDHYLLGWAGKGLGQYDNSFKPDSILADKDHLLPGVRIVAASSSFNLLWLGTDGGGVLKFSKRENDFGLLHDQEHDGSFRIPVRAFTIVNDQLWVGTKGNGIITIDNWQQKNARFGHIRTFYNGLDILNNCVYVMKRGKNGLVYIGSDTEGITIYDINEKKFIRWDEVEDHNKYPAFWSVHCILQDEDGSLWLGLNDKGLVHVKLQRTAKGGIKEIGFERFHSNGAENSLGSEVIYSLAAGSSDRIWIGCRYSGLTCYNKRTKTFKTYKAFTYNGSLSNNDVLSLYRDKENRLWIGTSFGLNWLKEPDIKGNEPQFNKLYVDNGLPNNTIHAISQDNRGYIWLSTNKGLARVNSDRSQIVQFKEADGLQSDEFSDNAVWKSSDGMLFFGGIAGFNFFRPENIWISHEQPRVLINDLQFAGKFDSQKALQVLTPQGAVANKSYTVGPQDNYFELSVQPITFVHSQKWQFAYFLEGNDHAWHFPTGRDRIIYNNLPPGTYNLMLKWSNGEGAWTQPVTAFTVTIRQHFWLTPMAFVIYASLILAAAWFYYRYHKNRFLMRQRLRMEHMLREKDEQLHQEQLNFFTNIAHELQTPLTLIIGAVERYLHKTQERKNKEQDYFLSMARQEASRLHYLVLQLLEFRKAQNGFLHNHFAMLDVSELVRNLSDLFIPLADARELDYSKQIDEDIRCAVDKDKLEKVIFNLLSNAFKYTPDGQGIIFSFHRAANGKGLEIVVANSGCELRPDEIDRLFERFFVAGETHSRQGGTGIGLAFTRQLVTLLNGTVEVICNDGWISFKVLLPIVEADDVKSENTDDHCEKPSYLMQSITADNHDLQEETADENNKRAMIKSFDDDRKIVLIVDDEQRIRYLLKDILKDYYIVYEAASGIEAMQVIQRMTPDLIISDIMMPEMDGLQFCEIIKSTPDTCHIPFVMLSARSSIEQKTEGYETGADAYIPKPFHAEYLLVRVHKLLEYSERLHKLFGESNNASRIYDSDIEDSDKYFIERVVRIIEENLAEDLDSAFLENALNMSKMQVYRRIKSLSNMKPAELIRHLRLQKASALLRTSDLTVSEIFYRTGFNNKTYFYREFKRVYNCSPNGYRAAHRLPDLN